MHEHVRGARHGAVAALIAGVRDPDFSRRQFVRETKKSPVGTGIGAEAFLPQKINGQESADEKKRNGDRDRRKSFPKITGDKMVGEFREERFGRWL